MANENENLESDEVYFLSDSVSEENQENLQALTIEDFSLGEFTSIGLIVGGSGLLVSLLVLGVLSILRTR